MAQTVWVVLHINDAGDELFHQVFKTEGEGWVFLDRMQDADDDFDPSCWRVKPFPLIEDGATAPLGWCVVET